MKKSPEELDPNFKLSVVEDGLVWHGLSTLMMEGLGWPGESDSFCRLPDRAENLVRPPVWELSRHSAGVLARFITDAPRISVRWTLRNETLAMDHMPATGVSGLDLYARHGDSWRWVGVGRATQFPSNEAGLLQDIDNTGRNHNERDYLLYLPLYNGVSNLQIGVPADATLRVEPRKGKPICIYGTSIVQGACAARAGMAYPAILGRRLDCPIINLGFSGNGQAEPEVAALLAELDPSIFIVDCLPNLDLAQTAERVKPLAETIKAAHPSTPVVLVENITYQSDWIRSSQPGAPPKNAVLQEIYQQLKGAGMQELYYVNGGELLDNDGEGTVDGVHPTDVGFMRMAGVLVPVLEKVLNHE